MNSYVARPAPPGKLGQKVHVCSRNNGHVLTCGLMSVEYAWPRRCSLTRSPDTLSPVYPDRPIRPMPKNRLKSRLSPEQAGSLIYPPDPPISSLSFNFPFGASEKADGRAVNGHGNHHYADQVAHCTCGGDHGEESEEEEIVYDHPNFRVQSPVEGVQQRRMAEGGRVGKAAPPASIASSADGYESFENTSNKKKRKIPLSGSSGVHQSSLTAELANMGISNGTDGASDDVPQHGQNSYPSSTGMGHAGAGRGRTSKPSPMRRRERVSISHQSNGYAGSVEQSVERGGPYKGDGTRISMTLPPAAPLAPSTSLELVCHL